MKTFRIVASVIALCLLISIVGVCGYSGGGDHRTTVSLAEGDVTIVRPAEDETCAGLSAVLFTEIKKQLGVKVSCADDTSEPVSKEIIIGNTGRTESAEAMCLLQNLGNGYDDDFIICENDGNIVIAGNSDASTEKAVEYFTENYVCRGEFEIGTYYANVTSSATLTQITVNGTKITSSNCTIITPLYNFSYIAKLQLDKLSAALTSKTGYTFAQYTDETAPSLKLTGTKYAGYTELKKYGNQLPVNFDNANNIRNWESFYSWYSGLNKTKTATDPSGSYEIVIGDCNRTGCPSITDPNEYQIKVSGTRIFLNGGSPYATAMAVSEFTKMVNSGSLALTNASSFTGDYYNVLSSYDRREYYTLAWSDDFDGTEIDTVKWTISYDSDNTYSSGLNGRNNYRASKELKNNYVKDGNFYIDAIYTDDAYYGGMLITNKTMLYKYGYIEASSLLPMGQGFWTSLWMSSGTGPNGIAVTEIDVNECYGASHYVYGNTFAWLSKGAQDYLSNNLNVSRTAYHVNNRNFSADTRGYYLDFHTFGYEWDENTVRFICDGKVFKEQNYSTTNYVVSASSAEKNYEIAATVDAFSMPLYLRLSMALGFASRGYVAQDNDEVWTKYNQYITDYVHIYQFDGQETYIYKTNNKMGDINKDGNVDLLDSAVMARYLASWTKYDFANLDLGAGDLDGDGLVTNSDLLILNQMLAGHGGYWGEESTPAEPDTDDEEEWLPWV